MFDPSAFLFQTGNMFTPCADEARGTSQGTAKEPGHEQHMEQEEGAKEQRSKKASHPHHPHRLHRGEGFPGPGWLYGVVAYILLYWGERGELAGES